MENIMENPQNPEQHQAVFEWNKVANPFKFIGGLLSKGVLCDGSNDSETCGLQAMMVQLAIKIACLQGGSDVIHSLTEALEASGNVDLIPSLRTWMKVQGSASIETRGDLKNKNFPVALRSLADQQITENSQVSRSTFFEHTAPTNGLSKVATLNCLAECPTKATLALEVDREKIVACFADGTVKLWDWIGGEERVINFGVKGEPMASGHITAIQYDAQILILGTAEGTVRLFDTRTQQDKWSIRLPHPVHFLRFVESTLVVLTRGGDGDEFWWVDISRTDMRLLNQRPIEPKTKTENSGILLMNPIYTFLYNSNCMTIQYTKSGNDVPGGYLEAPADISALNVLDLIPAKRLAVAGCQNGLIAIWTTVFNTSEEPVKTLDGHEEAVVSLCALNGHLLSLDQGGKLFMWSGNDLENKNINAVPRIWAENFQNVTRLVAHERWFVSSSSEDVIINIWTVPDVWLRDG